jgi:hypothetical protein
MGPSLVLDAHGRPRFAVATDEGTYLVRETASGWRRSRVWGDGDDPVLRLGPDGRSRIVDVRSDHRVWYGRATTAGMVRTRLTTHPARQAAFAVGPSDGRDHVVTVVGDRLWYTHSG